MDYTHLTFEQRYHIELGWRKGLAREVIARRIGVNRSTVYRELHRGQDPDGRYRASGADERARARARSSAANHPVKHSRQQPGHWEADTMLGNHTHPARVLTTVERTSRYTQLGLLPQGGKAAHTARVLRHILTSHKVRSITFDNGSEFAHYERACKALEANPYFAEPARPGQRGTCENTIGLIRQYLPKYRSLAKLTADKLNWIQDRLVELCLSAARDRDVELAHLIDEVVCGGVSPGEASDRLIEQLVRTGTVSPDRK